MTSPSASVGPVIMIGRCTECKRAYRTEMPAGFLLARVTAPSVYLGLPGCDCRTGARCPEGENGLPDCLDWECAGHEITQVVYRKLKGTYAPDVACGPGNCWGAKSSKCSCSCAGRNHGGMWAVTR